MAMTKKPIDAPIVGDCEIFHGDLSNADRIENYVDPSNNYSEPFKSNFFRIFWIKSYVNPSNFPKLYFVLQK